MMVVQEDEMRICSCSEGKTNEILHLFPGIGPELGQVHVVHADVVQNFNMLSRLNLFPEPGRTESNPHRGVLHEENCMGSHTPL